MSERRSTTAVGPVLCQCLRSVKILMVGAGGIGCELLKNLVLTGFKNIDVVDLDTIDVSNLNRQFLFRKQHVGKSKAAVACESVLRFLPTANIKYHHNNIMCAEFDVNFFKQFSLVLNALDNKAARSHVNRMCLSGDIPLIESGSAGYLGQVMLIKRGLTECYECTPKKIERSYPGCTIRNTPSQPVHCIVWAKHLFNQLFGEADIDEDVSPDMADPEVTTGLSDKSDTCRVSTRQWAVDNKYSSQRLFKKLFDEDIQYLLSMGNLWKKRDKPISLRWSQLPDEHPSGSSSSSCAGRATESILMKDQIVWTPSQCRDYFQSTVTELRMRLESKSQPDLLVWDKDDATSVQFVTACANLRAYVFGISLQSLFDVKSIAGNIIPAIATTNACVAGIIVMEALKIVTDKFDQCRCVFISRKPNPRCKILVDQMPEKPNPHCYVCSDKREVSVQMDTNTFTVKHLQEKVLKQSLNMVAPDVSIYDATGTIIISSEQNETTALENKTLAELSIRDGTRLVCDDYMQNFELRLIVVHSDNIEDGSEFCILSDKPTLTGKETDGKTKSEKSEVRQMKRNALDGMVDFSAPQKRLRHLVDSV